MQKIYDFAAAPLAASLAARLRYMERMGVRVR